MYKADVLVSLTANFSYSEPLISIQNHLLKRRENLSVLYFFFSSGKAYPQLLDLLQFHLNEANKNSLNY